jgi:hypothetical protein
MVSRLVQLLSGWSEVFAGTEARATGRADLRVRHVLQRLSIPYLAVAVFCGLAVPTARGQFSAAGLPRAQQSPGGAHGMGAKPCADSDFASHPRYRVERAAASQRPRRLILDDYLPEIGDQGRMNSCVGWSTAYYAYTYAVAKQRKLTAEQRRDPKFVFSPAFIYNSLNGGADEGITIPAAFDLLEKAGCATQAEMPYNPADFRTQPGEEARMRAARYKARGVARLYKGAEYNEPADPGALKTWLAENRRPFVISIMVLDDFPQGEVAEDFVYNTSLPRPANPGRHAVAIVGYDEDKHAFLMVNSWGAQWGHKGLLWLSEDFVKNYTREGWAQIPGGAVARWSGRTPAQVTPSVWLEPAEKPGGSTPPDR